MKPSAEFPSASNDNAGNVLSMPVYAWDIFYAASSGRRLGRVVAASAAAAIEVAAAEFGTDMKKLIAVRRIGSA